MPKKVEKTSFKKIISKWWFWVIVAVVFYIIFVSIPIQWTGEGLEVEEGTGFLKNLFAYLTQIAWIIVICLIIFDGIKWIQKSKIGNYWKIALTILGIVLIIAYVIFAVSDWAIFDNLSNKYDGRILDSDKDNIKLIKIHIDLIEERGYEVIYFGTLTDVTTRNDTVGYIKMKSLGNQNMQVWEGLTSLTDVYPDAPEYDIVILEPTQSCWYIIDGKLWKGYSGVEQYTLDGKNVTTAEFYNAIESVIENPSCS